jgi:selenophosphate synthase
LSHECPKKTHKTGTTTGYVGQSTKTTPRPAVTPYDESVPAETRTILFDSQTAGGLLLSVARADAAALLDALKECGRARS